MAVVMSAMNHISQYISQIDAMKSGIKNRSLLSVM